MDGTMLNETYPEDEGGEQIELDNLGLDWDDDDETTELIGDRRGAEREVIHRMNEKEEAKSELESIFKNPKLEDLLYGKDEFDRVWVSLKNKNSIKYNINNLGDIIRDGKIVQVRSIREALGVTSLDYIIDKDYTLKSIEDKIEDAKKNGDLNQVKSLEMENERIGEVIEETYSEMTLKDKVKYCFKKYGITFLGVASAVGAIIGVIISNLKSGLGRLGKGMSNGLKSIGTKLAGILPGIAGAIASFLFKTAGEAIGFLAKNTWLIIVGVVMYVIELIKKKNHYK